MQINELIAKVRQLPPGRQQEVMNFVLFLEQQSRQTALLDHINWAEQEFNTMSLEQAMRDLADEPELYTVADLKERWW